MIDNPKPLYQRLRESFSYAFAFARIRSIAPSPIGVQMVRLCGMFFALL
jgi:hypothetical protein